MELNFRLFNCDNTYNLDKIEALICKVANKLSLKANVEQNYFSLPRMKDLCNKLNQAGKMTGYAVFVVHAHESSLSLNNENAGIGYARLYRTLVSTTDGRVLIVIGGDDNYKDNEQGESFLSQWAWAKICSQFTDDDMNGVKSFIFSWDNSHNPIHEEALEFYLNPSKTGQTFVPSPKPKPAELPTPIKDPPIAKTQTFASNQGRPLPPLSSSANESQSQLSKSNQLGTPGSSSQVNSQPTGGHTTDLTQSRGGHATDPAQPTGGHTTDTAQPTGGHATDLTQSRGGHATDPAQSRGGHATDLAQSRGGHATDPTQSRGGHATDLTQSTGGNAPGPAQPTRPIAATDPLHQKTPEEQFQSIRATQSLNCPTLVVIPLLAVDERFVQQTMNVLDGVVKALNSPWTPCVSHVPIEQLRSFYKQNKPYYLVLVTEYEEFMELKDLPQKVQQLRWLFVSVKESTVPDTKLILVVAGNPSYTGDMWTSYTVDENALFLNNNILQPGKLMVLSWNQHSCSVHREVLQEQLNCQRENAILEKYRPMERSGSWRGSEGRDTSGTPTERTFIKMAEVHASDGKHRSLQVFCYHSNKASLDVVHHFFHNQVGIKCSPSKSPLQVSDIEDQVSCRQPEFVVFTTDIDFLQEVNTVRRIIQTYQGMFQPYIAKMAGIIVLLLGDSNYIDGHLASSIAEGYREEFTKTYPWVSSKLSVLSWKENPFIKHVEEMERLLARPNVPRTSSLPARPNVPGVSGLPAAKHSSSVEYDEKRGYLRYRANLSYGHVHKVLYSTMPPGWTPDRADLDHLAKRWSNEPEAVLEFWASSIDGPTYPPFVKKEKGILSKMRPSWL